MTGGGGGGTTADVDEVRYVIRTGTRNAFDAQEGMTTKIADVVVGGGDQSCVGVTTTRHGRIQT